MSRLNDLLRQLRMENPGLADDLQREYDALADRRSFGLNFERHVPEAVELPGRKVRNGDKVRVLPPRGQTRKKQNDRLWRVISFSTQDGLRHADLIALDNEEDEASAPVDDLVVVAEFRDPIYPGLVSTGKVERGGDKPYHAVINAENYHALQTLLFTHRGKVDCIYIDPPYNTGAKDWKYNNDYVEGDDLYRHSKWLAFMERRLQLAKELLKPADSALIVAIDEKEYLRLGMLLEQIFPEAKTQMISTVISPGGVPREREFTRVNEFLFFVMLGRSGPVKTSSDMLFTAWKTDEENRSPIWRGLLRGGSGPFREDSPSKFYPILVDPEGERIVGAGEALSRAASRHDYEPPEGLVPVWPIKSDGREGRWELNRESFEARRAMGFVKLGNFNPRTGQWGVSYLRQAEMDRLESGEIVSSGRSPKGHLELDYASGMSRKLFAKTVWNEPSHDAGTHGVAVVKKLIGARKFPFPKSLYAVEDALRFFVADKPAAVVVDFFAGSGTTAHAVMRLNRQDGGTRYSISVTNNEVSAEEQAALVKAGRRPGDPEWEERGICDHITKPRVRAAATGITPDGARVVGSYRFRDEFPMADGFQENVEFFTLTYEAPLRVASNREFEKIAALLWLRAGSRGRRIDDIVKGWDVADVYGVIADLDQADPFLKAIAENDDVAMAFIVTDEDRLFESMVAALPDHVEPVRLYEAYLRNFEIEAGRGTR